MRSRWRLRWHTKDMGLPQRTIVAEVKESNFLSSVAFTSDGIGLLSWRHVHMSFWDISSLGSRRGKLDSGSIDEEKECLTFHGHTVHYSFTFFVLELHSCL